MKNYYFTFGQNHWNSEGYPMKHSWVRVEAEDYEVARSLFIANFSSIYMETPEKWAFQYEADKFDNSYFKNGEFCTIKQNEIGRLESTTWFRPDGSNSEEIWVELLMKWNSEASKAMKVFSSPEPIPEVDKDARECYLYKAETYLTCKMDLINILAKF